MPYSGKFVPFLAHLGFFDRLRREANACIMKASPDCFPERRKFVVYGEEEASTPSIVLAAALAFALPLLAAGAYAAYRYLPKLEPLMQVALKVVVIP